MKCISLWQPWASLCVLGEKPPKVDETRHWATTYRGPLAIHAAQRWNTDLVLHCQHTMGILEALRPLADQPVPRHVKLATIGTSRGLVRLPLGCIVGVANLVAVRRTSEVRGLRTPEQLALGDYSDGRYAWVFHGAEALAEPVPFSGRQGLFDVPDSLLGPLAAPGTPDLSERFLVK